MDKRKKVILSIIAVITLIVVTIGLTYAYWVITNEQKEQNVVSSGCLDISLLNEGEAIYLPNQFPMSDEDGNELSGFTFTVKNNCNTSVSYSVNLESLGDADNSMRATSIKAVLDSNTPKLLDRYKEADITIKDAYEARILDTNTLGANGTATHTLKIWIDENAPMTEMNKPFETQITVSAGQKVFDATEAEILASMGLAYGDYVAYSYDEASAYALKKEYSGYTIDQNIAQMDNTNIGYEWRVIGVDDEGNVELAYLLASDKNSYVLNIDTTGDGVCDYFCDDDADGVVDSDSKLRFDQLVPNPNVDPNGGKATTRIMFGGAEGYNNGVFLLNDIAKSLYSNKSLGITARSINIDDLYSLLSDAGKEAIENIDNYKKEFELTTKSSIKYPAIYSEEKYSGVSGNINVTGLDESDPYYSSTDELLTGEASYITTTDSIKGMSTFWGDTLWQNTKANFINDKAYSMFVPKGNPNSGYWIASRYTRYDSGNIKWGLNMMLRKSYFSDSEYNALAEEWRFMSSGSGDTGVTYDNKSLVMFMMPVVTIPDEVKIVTNSNANSVSNMWTLKK